VLLPSDARRKPITSLTAVLLPFVTYLLTLPLPPSRITYVGKSAIPLSFQYDTVSCKAVIYIQLYKTKVFLNMIAEPARFGSSAFTRALSHTESVLHSGTGDLLSSTKKL
jgi:hypothetical protein